MRAKLFSLILLFVSSQLFAQLKSPDEFLGYELGMAFTPHYKVVNYFNQAAMALPKQMKIESYGETNEGRELLLAVVSDADNIARIEDIRKNNLRLAGILTDKPADLNAPAIVWLSYNVHGNEASSSEVSMKVLYELLNPSNPETKAWLKNTVVIIDPCLNPDGRDRYVNWFAQMVGRYPDANINSQEHEEPWPGGRGNHYNFDLNRDWAWQTQMETQLRIVKYNAWLPQVHCDFHEQGVGSPYYFAPAAEPFHDAVTAWQREFQTTIGKNHARYFDAKGWLYFTKEYFDLFYPSYGDTYPIFNGAIGMTYEQAGHSRGGLAVATDDGDTLTLKDRIAHHFTTSMSTIETSSGNAKKLTGEFRKYFSQSVLEGAGKYKTYVITETNSGKLAALVHFFQKNGIRYGSTSGNSITGYNYFTGQEERFTASGNLAVSALQPKSALVQVLFEPKSALSDSVTYDITAWSLPFVHGVQTYAVKARLDLGQFQMPEAVASLPPDAYGYLVSYHSFADVKFLAALLKAGVRTRYAEREFEYGGKVFSKGTLIVLKKGNEDKVQLFADLARFYKVSVEPVKSGFMDKGFDFGSDKVNLIKNTVVAILTGPGVNPNAAGEIWHLFDQQLNYPIRLMNAKGIDGNRLKDVDVLILPDGRYDLFKDKETLAQVKMWVQQGGKIITLDNAVVQMAGADWGVKFKKEDEEAKKEDKRDGSNVFENIRRYEDRERDRVVNSTPGPIYKVELDNSHPLAFGYPAYYYSMKLSSDIYEFMKGGWNVGVIKKENQAAGFVGSAAREKIKDGTVIGVLELGRGSVVFFADDPVFRNFWENGKMMLTNAVFLVGE